MAVFRRSPHPVREGLCRNGMAFLRLGSGPPVCFLPGLTAHHEPPRGMDRIFELQQLRRLAAAREVWWVNRRPGLRPGVTMADLARDYADVLRARVDAPIDVIGVSTGGSVALQLAADHGDLVRRLAVVSAAYRLGPRGRTAQRRVAELLRADEPRRASATLMATIGATAVSRGLLAGMGWVFAPILLGGAGDDLQATLAAEDDFDLRDRLGQIQAETLVIGGERDGFYGVDLFRQTAERIPRGRLVLYPGKGHMGTQDRRLGAAVLAFLDEPAAGPG